MTSQRQPPPPIAIVGMGMRLPGGIATPEEFWSFLVNKRSGRGVVPNERYNIDAFKDTRMAHHIATEHGYFLKDVNLKTFDASFFSMTRNEVKNLDPQQRLLLEVVWECMERAGQRDWRGSDIGCFVGSFGEDWHDMNKKDTGRTDMITINGRGDFALSNRVSYEYDLRGPSMTIRTACSSSLICLHEACQALYGGHCSGAIVGGTSIILTPSMSMDMSHQCVLAPDGISKSFDASADGFARAEGVSAIFIKLLDDAIRDGDPIKAIIRCTATNCDGKTVGMANPNPEMQESLIRKVYRLAGIEEGDVTQTPYIECHGTGTQAGDVAETTAIANAFGNEHERYIGSVKPNLGHAEGASGIISVIKVALALENNTIPPNIHFSEPNPKIPFEKGQLRVPVEPTPWPANRPARASVNNFGIGGANAHVILESAASYGISVSNLAPERAQKVNGHTGAHVNGNSNKQTNGNTNGNTNNIANGDTNGHSNGNTYRQVNGDAKEKRNGTDTHLSKELPPRLLSVSANDKESLRKRVESLRNYLDSKPESIIDAASYTLGARRDHLPYRAFCVAGKDGLTWCDNFPKSNAKVTKPVFVFTGQGAQWVGMAKELMECYPSVRRDIGSLDAVLQSLDEPPSWSLEELLCSNDTDTLINNAEFSQPLCTAIQIALVNFLARSGITPSAVVGHSSGEIAGAYAAKALTAAEAILVAFYRGRVIRLQKRNGAMAAVGLGRTAISPYLVHGVVVGCENSPQSVTLSGDEDVLEKVLKAVRAKKPQTFARRLHVDVAYHSHHMLDIGQKYEDMLRPHLVSREATIPFYSSVSNTVKSTFDASYWRSNLESPVLFKTAVSLLLGAVGREVALLEVGPHSALQGPLRQIYQHSGGSITYIPTLVRGEDTAMALITTLGKLFVHGHAVDFSLVNPTSAVLTDLPNYPWHHETEYWNENRISLAWRYQTHPYHELLGYRCLESSDLEPAWRHHLQVQDVAWLSDHKIHRDIVFPGAGYIAMAGEAIRQITGSDIYTARGIIFKTPLILPDTGAIEVVTTLKPVRLTINEKSSWYEFSISSCQRSSWVQHCFGQCKPGPGQELLNKSKNIIKPYPRSVDSSSVYAHVRRLGLNFGPSFQSLTQISAHTSRQVATAAIRKSEHRSRYSAHPIAIDACLQLCLPAVSHGISRRLTTLLVPGAIDSITVKACGGADLLAEASVHAGANNELVAKSIAVDRTSQVVIHIDNLTMAPLETSESSSQQPREPMAAARLEWRPAIDFTSPKDFIRPSQRSIERMKPLEQAAALGLLRVVDALGSLPSPPGHLAKHVAWLKAKKMDMLKGECAGPEAKQWATMDSGSRQKVFDSFFLRYEEGDDVQLRDVTRLICEITKRENIMGMFQGTINPAQILLEGDAFASIYTLVESTDGSSEFFSACAHAQPNLKVLEIGAGTGSTTASVLPTLMSGDGVRMYSEYVFSDISSGFFKAARNRFQDYPALSFKVLDIGKDPVEQGFEAGSYDLILAANVLHATPSLHETLRNVHSLLRPGGRLYLQELVRPLNSISTPFVMGWLPGWWLGENDGRVESPLVSFERWDQELRKAGFSGNDAFLLDAEPPFSLNGIIVSTAVKPKKYDQSVAFLYHEQKHAFANELASTFEQAGVRVSWISLQDYEGDPFEFVISTLELEHPFLYNISEENYRSLVSFVTKLKTGMLWLTRSAQIGCADASFGLVVGWARTLRHELSAPLSTVELQNLDLVTAEAILRVFEKQWDLSLGDDDFEGELAIRDGLVHSSRYHWISTAKELDSKLEDQAPKDLAIGERGLIDSLHWVHSKPTALKDTDVEVDVRFVGLNFRDVLSAMGIVTGAGNMFGLEASGVVTRVGLAVDRVKVGSRVMTMGPSLFTSRRVIDERFVVEIPNDLSYEDAATMPTVYVTVVHAVINVGQLSRGQSILIHSACGGIGIAAIQICKMLGAEIYVTVGNEDKVQHLMINYDIPRGRIFHSRDESFLHDIMAATGGVGVDMVLNSLSGELLHASWKCVAPYGRMMEIGKRDFIGRGLLRLDPFEANRTFHGIDLHTLGRDRPDEMARLLRQTIEYYEQGHIQPIKPLTSFPVDNIKDAFRYMQKGQHIGKIVISMDGLSSIPAIEERKEAIFSPSGTYLLVGGMGGLGKAIATWMVEHGARNILFLSRSAGKSEEDQAFLRELESQSCTAIAITGSVAELADVERAVQAAPTSIVGVIQLSMVLKDNLIHQISYDDWKAVLEPKVHGTWNLHYALSGANLDFFILFSSSAAVMGNPGQSNYTAANAFLQSFAQYRQGLGLPCSVIDVGMMEDVGSVSKNASLRRYLQSRGLWPLQEKELLNAIQISINNSLSSTASIKSSSTWRFAGQLSTGLAITSDSSARESWKRDARLRMYWNMESATTKSLAVSGEGLREFLDSITNNPEILYAAESLDTMTSHLVKMICSFMLMSEDNVDITMPLSEIGIDSLVSIEIRNWWRRNLGIEVKALDIIKAGTIQKLGEMAINSMKDKFNVQRHSSGDSNDKPSADSVDLVGEYSSYVNSKWNLQQALENPITSLPKNATVFLTGATGYLGTEILRSLLSRNSIGIVVTLVRAKSLKDGMKRIIEVARKSSWWDPSYEARIEVWVGDLGATDMGLKQSQLSRLQGKCLSKANIDAVIINGAAVHWAAPFSTLRKTNADAAIDLVKTSLASPRNPKIVYVSGGFKRDVRLPYSELAKGETRWTGYFQIKGIMESILINIASRLPADQNRISVVKPGLIAGPLATGLADVGNMIWLFTAGVLSVKAFPQYEKEGVWLPLVAADYTAEKVVNQILLPITDQFEVFVDMYDGLPYGEFLGIVQQELKVNLSAMSWDAWLQVVRGRIDELGKGHPLHTIEEVLESTRLPLPMPPANASDCTLNHTIVRKNIRYLVKQGFLTVSA